MEPGTRIRTRRIGGDLVIFKDDRVLIIARAAMDGWDVRQHRHALIHFDERRWRVASRAAFDANTVHYELEPWDPGEHEAASVEIRYDAEYVAARDRAIRATRTRNRASLFFIGFSPFLGLLPARLKGTIEMRYGVDSVASTWQSIILEYLTALVSLALASIGMISGRFPGLVFIPIAIVVAADGMMRWDSVFSEQRPPPGFFEWLFRRGGT